LCSRHTFCPQKEYDRTLFLFVAICKFRSHFRHSVTTANCKVSRLARLTSHMTLADANNYCSSRPLRFPQKYKSTETFWRTFVLLQHSIKAMHLFIIATCLKHKGSSSGK
jgi:hypothetical protein